MCERLNRRLKTVNTCLPARPRQRRALQMRMHKLVLVSEGRLCKSGEGGSGRDGRVQG